VSLAMGAIFIATSLLADLAVIYFNPRLRRAAA
jgi:ABC-type dipeptide/oligopeptide/nickel transport system permease component